MTRSEISVDLSDEDSDTEDLKRIRAAKRAALRSETQLLDRLRKLGSEVPDLESTIAAREVAIAELTNEIQQLDTVIKNERNLAIRSCVDQVRDSWLPAHLDAAYIVNDNKFIYIRDYSTVPEKQNVQVREVEPNKFCEELANEMRIPFERLPVPLIKQLFMDESRAFQISRYSIDPHIWNSTDVYLPIRHMQPYFIDRMVTEPGYSKFFDYLMYSLSGGTPENLEHIERWIVHKVKNYQKAVTTPDIVIVGHVGGNGKGILQAIIRQMFPACLSGKANSKTLNGNFNAIMMGKLIVFYDDQNSGEIPLEVVKQLSGSETMIYEKKGQDQYEGEKTHSAAWFSNTLPFKLTPGGQEGGVDRRFSVMRTNITFLESLRHHYQVEHNETITVEQSKDLAEHIVSNYLLNRVEIARWYHHLAAKYPDIDSNYVLKALHGADYHYFLDEQTSSIEHIWRDLVHPVLKDGGVVPVFVVKELLRHLEDRDVGDKTIVTKMRELAAQNRVNLISSRVNLRIEPSVIPGKSRYSVLHIDGGLPAKPKFDWSLLSGRPFEKPSAGQRNYIRDEDLIWGTPLADDLSLDDSDAYDVACDLISNVRSNSMSKPSIRDYMSTRNLPPDL